MGAAVKLAFNLFKLRIGIVIAATAIGGMAVQPGAAIPMWQGTILALAVLACSAAAGAFNQYYEYESDRRMSRTRGRPFGARPGWATMTACAPAITGTQSKRHSGSATMGAARYSSIPSGVR